MCMPCHALEYLLVDNPPERRIQADHVVDQLR